MTGCEHLFFFFFIEGRGRGRRHMMSCCCRWVSANVQDHQICFCFLNVFIWKIQLALKNCRLSRTDGTDAACRKVCLRNQLTLWSLTLTTACHDESRRVAACCRNIFYFYFFHCNQATVLLLLCVSSVYRTNTSWQIDTQGFSCRFLADQGLGLGSVDIIILLENSQTSFTHLQHISTSWKSLFFSLSSHYSHSECFLSYHFLPQVNFLSHRHFSTSPSKVPGTHLLH